VASGRVKRDWSEEKKIEVIEVFKKHFSNGRDERITFTMKDFQASFAKIFQTLVKNKIQLDKNFLYLGIMLVTLYLSLDELAGEYDVSSIFKDCVDQSLKKQNNSFKFSK
jgi:predicted unusual protein kinase regulating ubiquinone biosynthesis (AarF/ABC1/UbiB family)